MRNSFKQQGIRTWVSGFGIALGLPLLIYFGYCWGWWGHNSLLLQYVFQCSCPVGKQEARYPNQVDVIVSACRNANVRVSPSGHFLYVREEKLGLASTYLLDLQSMDKVTVTDQPFSSFLTDDLWFVQVGLNDYLMDPTTGVQYPIHKFVYSQPNAQISDETNLPLLAEKLKQAQDVFLIGPSTDTVVALVADFRTDPESNFTANRFDLPNFDTERFLQENQISYHTIPPDFPEEAVSPDGRFLARADGIYLIETGQKIVEGYSASKTYRPYSRKYFSVRGWTNDGTGVIYSKFLNPCLLETNYLIFDDYGCSIEVSQPIIKLKVPEEYLLSLAQ